MNDGKNYGKSDCKNNNNNGLDNDIKSCKNEWYTDGKNKENNDGTSGHKNDCMNDCMNDHYNDHQ